MFWIVKLKNYETLTLFCEILTFSWFKSLYLIFARITIFEEVLEFQNEQTSYIFRPNLYGRIAG